MKCPKCRLENREGVKFCEECGAKMELVCPGCGAKILSEKKFCGECGQALGESSRPSPPPAGFGKAEPKSYTPRHLAEKILTSRSTLEGERKLVTVMFADVAGFTALSEKLDPEDVHRIMDGCCRILVDEIHRSASLGATGSWPFSGPPSPMKITPSGPAMRLWPFSRP
jgi:hypothetical protein